MMAEEVDEQAEELRLLGNEAFANKKWEEAIDQYQESLSLDGDSKNSGMGYIHSFGYDFVMKSTYDSYLSPTDSMFIYITPFLFHTKHKTNNIYSAKVSRSKNCAI